MVSIVTSNTSKDSELFDFLKAIDLYTSHEILLAQPFFWRNHKCRCIEALDLVLAVASFVIEPIERKIN